MRPVLALLTAVLSLTVLAAPAHAQRAWDAPVAFGPPAPVSSASAAVLDDGRIALVWEGAPGDASVYASVTPGMEATRLGEGTRASVTPTAGGRVLFGWRATSSGYDPDDAAHLRTWTPADGLSATTTLAPPLDGGVLTATDAAGDLVVAHAAGARTVTRYWPSGGTLGGPADVAAGAPQALGLGAGGRIVVAVRTPGGLRTLRRVGDGAAGDEQSVPLPEPVHTGPSIAVDDAGRAAVITVPGIGGTPVALAGAPGQPWQAMPGFQAGGDGGMALASDAAGNLVAAWAERADLASPFRVRAATGDLTSGAWTAPVDLDGGSGVGSLGSLTVRPDGSALVTYAGPLAERVVRRTGLGAFEAPQTPVCNVPAGQSHSIIGLGTDAAGSTTLVTAERYRGALFVVRDRASDVPANGPCPATPPATQLPQTGAANPGAGTPQSVGATKAAIAAVRGQRLGTVLRKGLRLGILAVQPGKPVVALVVPRAQARKLRLGRRAITVGRKAVTVGAGPNAVTVPVTKRYRRKLAKARRLTVQVRISGASAGLNLATTVTLRR